jgi:mono/diheme cytochrome c family protein
MLNLSATRITQLLSTITVVITLVTVASFQGRTAVGSAAAGSDGKKIYNARCSICHGVDGRGNTALGRKLEASDLNAPEVQNQSDDLLKETVMYGMGKMPRFEKKLNPDKIKQVLAYIRELSQKK